VPDLAEKVERAFWKDGHLARLPAKRAKRLLVLDRLAQRFEPGRAYLEAHVNQLLVSAHPDYAMVRRALVDEGFLARENGWYWRIGGTVCADADADADADEIADPGSWPHGPGTQP
jgi:hypothetical protein